MNTNKDFFRLVYLIFYILLIPITGLFAKEKEYISFNNNKGVVEEGNRTFITLDYNSNEEQLILVRFFGMNYNWLGNGERKVGIGKGTVTVEVYFNKEKLEDGKEYRVEALFVPIDKKRKSEKEIIKQFVKAFKNAPLHNRLDNLLQSQEERTSWKVHEGKMDISSSEDGQTFLKLGQNTVLERSLPIDPYKHYRISFYGKVDEKNASIKIKLGGHGIDHAHTLIQGTEEKRYTLFFSSPINKIEAVQILCEVVGKGGIIRNMSITSIPTPVFKEKGYTQFSPTKNSLKFFESINSNDGLSQNSITTIYKDSEGFMWFGSDDGLNKFDGHSVTIYKNHGNEENEISSNLVYAIAEDRSGNMWFGTRGGGLNCLNKQTQKFIHYKHKEGDTHSLSNSRITHLLVDSKNRLWITHFEGVDMLDLSLPEDERKFVRMPIMRTKANSDKKFTRVYEKKNGQIWFTSNLCVYKLEEIEADEYYLRFYQTSGAINAITEDTQGRLILGSSTGIQREVIDPVTGESLFVMASYGGIRDILFDKQEDVLWVAGTHGLVEYKLDDEKIHLIARYAENNYDVHSLSSNELLSLYKDEHGILWIGTSSGGVNKLDLKRKKFYHITQTPEAGSILNSRVRSILFDSKDGLWVGTGVEGVNYLPSYKTSGYENFQHKSDIPKVFVLTEVKTPQDKYVLMGTQNGYMYYASLENKNNLKLSERIQIVDHAFGAILDIFQDSRSNIWIATYGKGLYRIDNKFTKESLVNFPYGGMKKGELNTYIIRSIEEDSFGNIWIGTAEGLSRIDAKDAESDNPNVFTYVNDKANPLSISNNYILDLYSGENGEMWIGTIGGGLNKYVPFSEGKEEQFTRYSTQNGLPNNTIKGILEDREGNLWISTNFGLSKFDPKKEVFKNYDQSDGLQGNEFQDLSRAISADGMMAFGGVNGFSMFYPKEINENTDKPIVAFTQLKLLNEEVEVGEAINGHIILEKDISLTKELEFHHTENSFSLEFAALHYASPNKNQYAYMLEGFDEKWIPTNAEKRWVTYTNLDAGEYTLKIKASNNDGIWSEENTTLKVIILPPWWETWTFRFFMLVLFIALSIGFYRYKVYSYKQEQRVLEAEVQKRTHDLQEAHDEILAQNAILEEQAEELEVQREDLEKKNSIISEANDQVVSSIRYAKTIQKAILPSEEELNQYFGEHFTLFKPKDIVSGDFYWSYQSDDYNFIVVADCTGHGVPGAFMSMVGNSLLNKLIKEQGITDVHLVLKELNKEVHHTFKQAGGTNDAGMDMVICRLEKREDGTDLVFAGAKNPLYYYNKSRGEIKVIAGSKKSIGGIRFSDFDFEKKELALQKGDKLYLVSDGYLDQNRKDRKKFGKTRFIELLTNIAPLDIQEQEQLINQTLDDFMLEELQRDDITVIGLKIG